MSWTFSVPQTPRDDFEAAVDAAVVTGQDGEGSADPEAIQALVAADVATVKAAIKSLASMTKRGNIRVNVTAHTIEPGQESGHSPTWLDGASVAIFLSGEE